MGSKSFRTLECVGFYNWNVFHVNNFNMWDLTCSAYSKASSFDLVPCHLGRIWQVSSSHVYLSSWMYKKCSLRFSNNWWNAKVSCFSRNFSKNSESLGPVSLIDLPDYTQRVKKMRKISKKNIKNVNIDFKKIDQLLIFITHCINSHWFLLILWLFSSLTL